MKKIGFIAAGVIIALLTLLLSFPWRDKPGRDLQDILNEGRLWVLIESGEHGYTRDSLKVRGFQYEVIKRFTDELGVELVITNQQSVSDGMKELAKGNFDVLVALHPVISDTLATLASLHPLFSSRLMLVQKKDSTGKVTISRQYQLDGKAVSVVANSSYISILESLSEDLAIEITIEEHADMNLGNIVNQVAKSETGFTVCPEYLSYRLCQRYPGVDMLLPLSFPQPLAWKVRRDAVALQQEMNLYLAEFVQTVEFQRLYNQYFESPDN